MTQYDFDKLVKVEKPIPQNTDEWLMARQGRVTASDRAYKLINSRQTTINLMMDKMADELGVQPEEWSGVVATRHGHTFEDQAIGEYEMARLGLDPVVRSPGFHVHPTWTVAGATPDFFEGDDITGQIKCPYKIKNHNDLLHFGVAVVQPKYYVQVQFEGFVTGRPRIMFVSYHPDAPSVNQLHFEEVPLDLEMQSLFARKMEVLEDNLRDNARPGKVMKSYGIDELPPLF